MSFFLRIFIIVKKQCDYLYKEVHGLLYILQFDIIFFYSGGVTSKPLERQDRLHPEPVSGLNATKITDKEITLVWQPPIGDYDHFDVLYDRGFGRDRLTTNSTLVNSITIRRLRPFKNYTFSVFTISGKKLFCITL